MDRRSAKRFLLQLRCFVTTTGPQPLHLEGRTENISRSGVLICHLNPLQCDGLLRPGEDVDIDVELPQNPRLKRTRSLHCRATIVGQRSFGKGTVQKVIELEKDCGAIRLTTAGYWRPSGKNINRKHGASDADQWGVEPDAGCTVVVAGEDLRNFFRWRMKRDEQQPGENAASADDYRTADRQLDKAVEVLQKK